MKTSLFLTLFLLLNMGLYAQEKTYIIEIHELTLNSVSLSWHRTDGTSDKDSVNEQNTPYIYEFGIKGFERSESGTELTSTAGLWEQNLIPDTEYSLFIRKESVGENSSVWFEEYNFKTLLCNTNISNIKTEMVYAEGKLIKDLIDVRITFDQGAESCELEYGLKGFVKGTGTTITSTGNRFSTRSVLIGNANLRSNTEYDYYIRAKCKDEYGEWSVKQSFVTTNVFYYLGDRAFEVDFSEITNKSVFAHFFTIVGDFEYYDNYIIEYGPKGFIRGTGKTERVSFNQRLYELKSNTEYSLFITKWGTRLDCPEWFTEHTFKTLPCNTSEISGLESQERILTCMCSDGPIGIGIKWNDNADSYEFEYGKKGFIKGTGKLLKVTVGSSIEIMYKDLDSFTEYDYYVRGECSGVFGESTDKNTFFTTTGLENIQTPNFEVFPNPVEDILYITLNSAFDIQSVIVSVVDMTGLVRYKSEYKDNYNLSSLPKGTYIVSVSDKKLSKSLIIQKK